MKQILVVRKDLKMRRGKECAQCAHASVGVVTSELFKDGYLTKSFANLMVWLEHGQAKITVTVNSEEEMDALYVAANAKGIMTYQVIDHGRTEFNGVHTKTVLAIGPAPDEMFVGLTDHLPLY